MYELGKVFRNEGMDKNHSPEFTSMECYMAYGNQESMMDLMEQIVYKCAMEVNGSPIISYEGKTFDVTPPWNKIDMTESVIKVTGIPFDKIDDDAEPSTKAIIEPIKLYGMLRKLTIGLVERLSQRCLMSTAKISQDCLMGQCS